MMTVFRKKKSNISKQAIKELSIKFISGLAKPDDINEWKHHLGIVKQEIQSKLFQSQDDWNEYLAQRI